MNFLAHDVVLPPDAPAVLRVAAAVPDLWSFLPKRPLPATIRERLGTSRDPAVRAVAQGVDAHLRADATFHRHPEFQRRMDWLEGEMRSVWPGLGSAALGAHVMVEMLLDRWLLRGDPGLVERYYASFSPTLIAFVSTQVSDDRESQEAMTKVLHTFTSTRFLADYPDRERLVMRFVRRLERIPFVPANDPPVGRLVSLLESWSHALEEGSAELLEAVRRAIRANAA